MEKDMSKKQLVLFFVTLCLTNIAMMVDSAIIPAVDGMFSSFPDQVNLVNYIISGAALLSVIGSILGGKLIQYFSKKSLMLVSLGVFGASSIFGAAVLNATYMAVMRSFVGISWGVINVTAMAMIAEVFITEEHRSKMMGTFNSAMSLVGALLSFVAGFLAANSWQSVFKVFWISIPILLMSALFLPKTPAEGKILEGNSDHGGQERIPVFPFWSLIVSFFLFSAGYFSYIYNISVFVSERAIGDASLAGILASFTTLGSAVGALALGFIYSKFKTGSILISYILMMACLVTLYITHNVTITCIATALSGAAFGSGVTYFYLHTTFVVPPTRISYALGFTAASTGLGMFFSTFLATLLKNLLGVDTNAFAGIIPALVGVLAIGGAISFVATIKGSRSVNESAEPA